MNTSPSKIPDHAKLVFEGQIFQVYQWEQKLFDGTTAIFERLKRPDTVVVFPVIEDGKILLVKEQQPNRSEHITAPGGRVEPGEDISGAAARELSEETGYSARDLKLWHSVQPASKIDWSVHYFIGLGAWKTGEQKLDSGEKIELYPTEFEDFLDILLNSRLTDQQILRQVMSARHDGAAMKKLRLEFGF